MTRLFMVHPGPLPVEVPTVRGHRVRPATPEDAPRLLDTLRAAFDEPWDMARLESELLACPEVPRTWVAEADSGDGPILATSSELIRPTAYGAAGCVHWVGTTPQARGLGLGALVTVATLAGFAEHGLPSAVLNTDDDRDAAVRLYLRLGFLPEPRNDAERTAWSAFFQRTMRR